MTRDPGQIADVVADILDDLQHAAIAVSGGVDSMTLAVLAERALGPATEMFHAVSPAVPADGTARVRRYAAERNWRLNVLEAGEFRDPNYMSNPLNRCYFCKTNLYDTITAQTSAVVLSGTNMDDLGEYRPGLTAAQQHSVRHPFVEAEIDKSTVRRLAAHLGLNDLAELPAAPCLSSRMETGIAIDPDLLPLIDRAERVVRSRIQPDVVRCRVRATGVVVELDAPHYADLAAEDREAIAGELQDLFGRAGYHYAIGFTSYRTGSAFVDHARP